MSTGTLPSIADDKTIPSEYGPVFDIRSGFFGDDADPKERREMAGIRIGVESLRVAFMPSQRRACCPALMPSEASDAIRGRCVGSPSRTMYLTSQIELQRAFPGEFGREREFQNAGINLWRRERQ